MDAYNTFNHFYVTNSIPRNSLNEIISRTRKKCIKMQPINVKRSINPNKIDIIWLLRGNVVDVLIYWSKSKNLMMKTASNPIIRHFCSIICIEHKLNHFSPRSRSKLNGSLEMSVPVYPKYINHTDQQEIAKLWILILFWRFSVRPESAEKEYK